MRQRALLIDVVVAVAVAVVVLVVSPGLAITAIVAALVLLALAVDGLLRRRRQRGTGRRPAGKRPRPGGRG